MPLTLLHPALFALGLASVSIPIILHLLKRKRRPIPWGAMRFLEQAYRKRRRVLTIEQLILLVLRCLLLALLALGVGSLMLGSGLGRSVPTTMVIVIDNSISSALDEGGRSGLEINKAFAIGAIDELDAMGSDQAMLIGAGMPATGIVVPQSSDLSAIRSMINALEPTDSAFDLSGALTLAGQMQPENDRPVRTVLVVASQGRGFEPATQDPSSTNAFDRVMVSAPASATIENIGIARATPTRSLLTKGGVTLPVGVLVELIRSGAQPQQETTTTLRVLDQQGTLVGQRLVRWDPGESSRSLGVALAPDSLKTIGARTAMLSVEIDPDANPRDNIRRIPLATRATIRVGIIDRPDASSTGIGSTIVGSRWVRAALAPSDDFGITIVDIDARRASSMLPPNLDALFVLSPSLLDGPAWDRIEQLNASSMLVVFTPDAASASLDWLDRAGALGQSLIASGSVLSEHPRPVTLATEQSFAVGSLLSGIGAEFDRLASTVALNRTLRLNPGKDALPVAMLSDDSPLALSSRSINGRGVSVVFACAFDLGWTNLPARPLFVAMMQELVRQGVGLGSTMPSIQAGARLPSRAWVKTNQRLSLHDGIVIPAGSSTTSSTTPNATSIAGVIAQLDSQGATRAFVVINPDARSAITDPTPKEKLGEAITSRVVVDQIEWVDAQAGNDASPRAQPRSSSPSTSDASLLGASTPGVSMALWMLSGAGIIGVIELLLARVFTAKLFEQAIERGSA